MTATAQAHRAQRSPIARKQLTGQTIPELMAKPALTLREAAQVLDVSTDLLLKLINSGEGPSAFKIGRVTYVRTETLANWLRRLEAEAEQLGHSPATSAA